MCNEIKLTQADLDNISCRLDQVIHSLRAIHYIANESIDGMNAEMGCIAISEMARANIKGLDVICSLIGGEPHLRHGNFESELSRS